MIRHHRTPQCTKATIVSRRRGVVTVMVILVLVLMSAMVAEYVHRVVSDHRQMRLELYRSQTQQLAMAGVTKMHKLRMTSDSEINETWNIPPGTIHDTNSATVSIVVKDDIATVVARYPANQNLPIQVTRTIRLAE